MTKTGGAQHEHIVIPHSDEAKLLCMEDRTQGTFTKISPKWNEKHKQSANRHK